MRNLSRERCYEILRVRPGAARYEVQRAFRQRVLECHPDLQQDPEEASEARLKQVVHAYRLLCSGKALSRHDLLEEAFKATASITDTAPEDGRVVLMRLEVSARVALALMIALALLSTLIFVVLFTILSSPPPGNIPVLFELAPDQIACLVMFITAQIPGAAAAGGENVVLDRVLKRGALAGLIFGGVALVLGVMPLLQGSRGDAGFSSPVDTAVVCLAAGVLGGMLGAGILYLMQRYEFALYHKGARTVLENRVAAASTACLNLALAWVAALLTGFIVVGIPAALFFGLRPFL